MENLEATSRNNVCLFKMAGRGIDSKHNDTSSMLSGNVLFALCYFLAVVHILTVSQRLRNKARVLIYFYLLFHKLRLTKGLGTRRLVFISTFAFSDQMAM